MLESAPQTIDLIKKHAPKLAERAGKAEMYPCWTLMVGFEKPLDEIKFDGAFVNNNPISWICRNSR